MINHVWTVLCQSSAIDRDENQLSLHNVIEEVLLQGPAEPKNGDAVPLSMHLVSLWHKELPDEEARGAIRAILVGPDGDVFKPIELAIDLTKANFFRSRIFSAMLKWKGQGKYVFHVEFLEEGQTEWHEVIEIPFWIVFRPIQVFEEAEQTET